MMDASTEEKVRKRAYELWEAWGRPDQGSDMFWLIAENQIAGEVVNSEMPNESLCDGILRG